MGLDVPGLHRHDERKSAPRAPRLRRLQSAPRNPVRLSQGLQRPLRPTLAPPRKPLTAPSSPVTVAPSPFGPTATSPLLLKRLSPILLSPPPATGEPIKPPDPVDEGTHLENIAGVLHYAGTPIIAINRLHPGWPSFGNRYVMAFPNLDDVSPEARADLAWGLNVGRHLIECATCRRWSITDRLVYRSANRAQTRADEAREKARA